MRWRLILFVLLSGVFFLYAEQIMTERYAGFRASRILSSYPNRQFPTPQYWEGAGKQMADNFPAYEPAGLWIVSIFLSNPHGYTKLNFPSSGEYPDSVLYRSTDQNEDWLLHFDTTGMKVWLQVEPGGADIDTLISIVLNRYKHHPCVMGFGVDVEWYQTNTYHGGRKVSNLEAQRWEEKVKSIDSTYTLFLKHYSQSWMPSSYRGNLWFVDDSQNFNWGSSPFNNMINEFKSWGTKFSPNPVAFQFGYNADKNWWYSYTNPPNKIGSELKKQISNCCGLFWVDFTIMDVFSYVDQMNRGIPQGIYLGQNYPNPFNPETTIPFDLSQDSEISIKIYDLKGNTVAYYPSHWKAAGHHELLWNAENQQSGIYFYKISTDKTFIVNKCILAK
jgi:hypothetical protein